MLHERHGKRIWNERRKDKGMDPCSLCDAGVSDEIGARRSKDWTMLANLAIAVLLLMEFGDSMSGGTCTCGAPTKTYTDHQKFCWGCGVDDADNTYSIARSALKKYKIDTEKKKKA